jgi:transposase-like protein
VPRAFLAEFRADVIAVAREGAAPLRQTGKGFGVSEVCLHRWLEIADRGDGVPTGLGRTKLAMSLWSCAKCANGSSSSSRKPR